MLLTVGFVPLALFMQGTSAASGDLDPSFGSAGKTTTNFFGQDDFASAVALQSDGKIIVAGSATLVDGTADFALTRYNADGSLDMSFGSGGKTTTDFFGDIDLALGAAVQPDGKIVAVGTALKFVTDHYETYYALARYQTDGTLDPTFGAGGKVTTDLDTNIYQSNTVVFVQAANVVRIQSNNKIVVAGGIIDAESSSGNPAPLSDFGLARYNADGTLDTSFGLGGKRKYDFFERNDIASALVLQVDGKIVAAGTATKKTGNFDEDFACLRVNSDGTRDTSFGTNGVITTDFVGGNDEGNAAVIQLDGKIVVGGVADRTAAGGSPDMALTRFNVDGSLDTTFGAGGKLVVDFSSHTDVIFSLAIQIDGKIVAAGGAGNASNVPDFALARFSPDGTMDQTFGANGKIVTDFFGGEDYATGIAFQPDNKIVITGPVANGGIDDFGLARYLNPDVTPTPTPTPSPTPTPTPCPAVNFAAPVNFGAGFGVWSVTVGDFNGDGKQDLAVVDQDARTVSILLGNGAGSFGAPTGFGVGGGPFAVAVGDFNGDGKQDLAVANAGSSDVSILLGNGAGGFSPATNFAVGTAAGAVAVGDFNGDGKQDLAVAIGFNESSNLAILLGNGMGGFGAPTNFGVGTNPVAVAVSDFNGDNKQDVAVLNQLSANVSILLGDGAGGFGAATNFPAGSSPNSFAVGDFNGDGSKDLAVTNSFEKVSILLGNGMGGFGAAKVFGAASHPTSVTVGEFNGDGRQDLAVTYSQSSSNDVVILLGDGAGNFTAVADFSAGNGPQSVAVGDFNGDGKQDLVVANSSSNNVSILLGGCPGTPEPTPTPSPSPVIQFAATGFSVNEGEGRVTITVNRSGGANTSSSVDYKTTDTDDFTANCAAKNGTAFGRCDFATTVGTLSFAPGETSKTFSVPIIDDSYAEGNEIFGVFLSNPSGATLSGPLTAIVTISDNETINGTNPILKTDSTGIAFFVRQHYLDFLGREPDQNEPWTAILNGCSDQFNTNPNSPAVNCDRILVSSSFFGSPEFKDKGFYIIGMYRVAFNRLPSYVEFSTDLASITGTTAAEVFGKRAAYAASFVQRTEFTSIYFVLNDTQFVNALMSGAQGQAYNLTSITTKDPANPDTGALVTLTTADLISRLAAGSMTRAQVLRAIAQSNQITLDKEAVNAFVATQYYGYLRRTPDPPGFNGWVNYLKTNPSDFRTMVNGFLNSQEYRLRFGP